MRATIVLLLPLIALALGRASGANATPVQLAFSGHITAGNSPITGVVDPSLVGEVITGMVSYDLATAQEQGGDAYTAWAGSETGTAFGSPWDTWIHVSASWDGQSVANDLAPSPTGSANTGIVQVIDDMPDGSGALLDASYPFAIQQVVLDSSGAQIAYRYMYLWITSVGTPADVGTGGQNNLIDGLSLTQPINLGLATGRTGWFEILNPGFYPQSLYFTVDRLAPVAVSEPPTVYLAMLAFALISAPRRRVALPQSAAAL